MSTLSAAPRRVAGRLAAVRPRRPRRRTLILLALAVVLLGGGWLWLRDSSLVAVERVDIRGLSGPGAAAAATALRDAARSMTTLDVDEARLRRVASAFPAVRGIRVSAHPPNRLVIVASPQVPVAALLAGGRPLAVAADGTLLPQAPTAGLAQVGLRSEPAGGRLQASAARMVVAALAAAPRSLRARATRGMITREHGIVIELRNGPALYLGPEQRLRAKWVAAARVLADPSAAGATYVDLSSPERPAVGGLLGGAQPGEAQAGFAPPQDAAGTGTTGAGTATDQGTATDPGAAADPGATAGGGGTGQ